MEEKEIKSTLQNVFGCTCVICFIPFMYFIVLPFFNSFTPENRLEKFINDECIEGNEIAIRIKRERIRYHNNNDYNLVRSAIEGNEHAIRALGLDSNTNFYTTFR